MTLNELTLFGNKAPMTIRARKRKRRKRAVLFTPDFRFWLFPLHEINKFKFTEE